jgi:hypothetical protein
VIICFAVAACSCAWVDTGVGADLVESQLVRQLVEVRHAHSAGGGGGGGGERDGAEAAVLSLDAAASLVFGGRPHNEVLLMRNGAATQDGVAVAEAAEVAVGGGAAETDMRHAERRCELVKVRAGVAGGCLEAVALARLDAVEVGGALRWVGGRTVGVEDFLEGDYVGVEAGE